MVCGCHSWKSLSDLQRLVRTGNDVQGWKTLYRELHRRTCVPSQCSARKQKWHHHKAQHLQTPCPTQCREKQLLFLIKGHLCLSSVFLNWILLATNKQKKKRARKQSVSRHETWHWNLKWKQLSKETTEMYKKTSPNAIEMFTCQTQGSQTPIEKRRS